jgi:hypothetical protein
MFATKNESITNPCENRITEEIKTFTGNVEVG